MTKTLFSGFLHIALGLVISPQINRHNNIAASAHPPREYTEKEGIIVYIKYIANMYEKALPLNCFITEKVKKVLQSTSRYKPA